MLQSDLDEYARFMKQIRLGILILWGFALLALAFGFLGFVHPIGDSLAVFRLIVLVGFAAITALLVIVGPRSLGLAGLAVLVATGATMVPPSPSSTTSGEPLTVYQKNLLFRQPDLAQVVADIRLMEADIIFLQEMHARNRPIMELLASTHPYSHLCPFAAVGGVAVLSKFPIAEADSICIEDTGLALIHVEAPDGAFWAASIHLHWPWPHRQPEDVALISDVLGDLEGPVILGGDFNMVPWSHAMRRLRQASRTTHAGYPGGTFDLIHPWFPIAIDHALMPEGATLTSVEKRPKFGSDHRGVVARFVLR